MGTGATAVLWTAAATAARGTVAGPPTGAPVEDVVTRLCLGGLVVSLLWAWLQVVAGVADAWRGSAPVAGGAVRRVVAVACGAALVGALGAPSTARADGDPHPATRTVSLPLAGPPLAGPSLAGLPLPDRTEGAAGSRPPAQHDRVVVRPGDSLWAIAARRLDAGAPGAEITDHWLRLHAANRAVVGPDPDLIHPGQVLRITKEKS